MLPDTTPILPPLEPSPDDLAARTTGPAQDFDYARPVASPMGQPPAPSAAKFDPMTLVKDRPWIAVGVALAAGLGAGLVLFSRPKHPKPGEKAVDVQGHGPSIFDTIVGGIGEELMQAGKHVVDELAGAMKEKAQSAVASVQGLIGQATGA